MLKAASVLCFFLACALLHRASPKRRALWRAKTSEKLPALRRAGAVVAMAVGVTSWSRAQNTTAAVLVALAALSVAATAFVLLVPLFPRTLWGLALVCPVFIAVLLVLGVSHG